MAAEDDRRGFGAEAECLGGARGVDEGDGGVDAHGGHLAGDEAAPDEGVEAVEERIEAVAEGFGIAGEVGGADGADASGG